MKVSAGFEARIKYNLSEIPEAGGKVTIEILNKTYVMDVPPLKTFIKPTKTGTLNIKIFKLKANPNGSYSIDTEISPDGIVSYHHASRTLSFNIPDPKLGYRFIYTTDITGEPTKKVENNVALMGIEGGGVGTKKEYTIASADSTAVFQHGGLIKVTKTSSEGPLLGAEFTLFASDGTPEINKRYITE